MLTFWLIYSLVVAIDDSNCHPKVGGENRRSAVRKETFRWQFIDNREVSGEKCPVAFRKAMSQMNYIHLTDLRGRGT